MKTMTRKAFAKLAASAPFVFLALRSDGSRAALAQGCEQVDAHCHRFGAVDCAGFGCETLCQDRHFSACAICQVCFP